MAHIVLLGDSVFDNKVYTGPDPSVSEHLRRLVGDRHAVTLCAVDGSVTREVAFQLPNMPTDASHLILSTGGNDALAQSGLLGAPASSFAEVLSTFAAPLAAFASEYDELLTELDARGLPLTVCTIYNGNLNEPEARPARVAVGLFNDIIYRVACRHHAGIIELRDICTEPSDYANPIEPSGPGGARIAEAIVRALSRER